MMIRMYGEIYHVRSTKDYEEVRKRAEKDFQVRQMIEDSDSVLKRFVSDDRPRSFVGSIRARRERQ